LLKVGIVGCGHWGLNHVRIFYCNKSSKIKICCDRNPSRLKVLSKIYPDLAVTTNYTKVLNDSEIDAVVIATPTATHYGLVRAFLLSGKHVLCEKPLVIKKREAEKLILLAEKKRKTLMSGYVFLFNDGIAALKKYVNKKGFGRIFYLHFTRTNLGPIRNDVDVIYDLASHDISITSFLLEGWPKSVSANAGFFLRKKVCDTAFITLYYPGNRLVNIHASWLDPQKIRTLTCVGDKKMAIWNDLSASEPVKIFDKGIVREPFYSDYSEFQLLPREGAVTNPVIGLTEPLRNQNNHFLNCINKNKTPLTDGKFGHNVTVVLEALRLSLREKGRIQEIKEKYLL